MSLIILCFCFCNFCIAQTEVQKKDSTKTIYKKAKNLSNKSKVGRLIQKLIFKSNKKVETNTTSKQNQNFVSFEGKIIRHIKVKSNDPFGFSFNDVAKKPDKWIERTGNNLHTKSKRFAIKNFLIFKKHTPLDSLKVIESERLIRAQKFIKEVEITVKHIDKSKDSVDVYITTLDSWTLLPSGSISQSKLKLQLTEQNFLGFGHELKIASRKRFNDKKSGTNLLYRIPNMKNTYITSVISYDKDFDGFYSKRFNLKRPFFSPYTKWAAGVYIDQQFSKVQLQNNEMQFGSQDFKYQSQDLWAGYSFKLFKGNSVKERSTNIISTVRLLNVNYSKTPLIEYDSISFYSNETLYLASVGISSRQFIKDNYIFRDGITENVPIGNVLAITLGKQFKNYQNRFYIGLKISQGNYYNWGYLSTSFQYETFIKNSKPEQTTYAFSANYFTNLITIGDKWAMRQFIKPQFLIGKNRLNSVGDRLTIDDSNTNNNFSGNQEQQNNRIKIPGFDSELYGTSKFALTLQSQVYTPWKMIGFRLNPYLNINMAMLKNENKLLNSNTIYSAFGVGVILRNDYLVFNSIKLSFTYYPNIPGQGKDVFNTNVKNREDFGLQDFNLGKPSTIIYN